MQSKCTCFAAQNLQKGIYAQHLSIKASLTARQLWHKIWPLCSKERLVQSFAIIQEDKLVNFMLLYDIVQPFKPAAMKLAHPSYS